MKRKIRGWVMVGLLALSIACSGIDVDRREGSSVSATMQVPASSTVGIRPTVTGEPAIRATATPHLLPTHTEAATPTSTPTPTTTSQPPATATALPTSVPGTPLPTPALMPTLPGRQGILLFTASPNPVERGGTVRLAWDTVRVGGLSITRLSEEGAVFLKTEALGLAAAGSLTVKVPEDYVESVTYYLGARSADGTLYKAYATVRILCPYNAYLAPRCPLARKQVRAAYEPFERGHLVWRGDTREITALYEEGSYESYKDTWQEGDPVDVPGSPPPGRFAPVRGFGHLYAHQSHLRERLGWATSTEVGYTMTVETLPGGSGLHRVSSTYFTLPDGRVIHLYPFSSTWRTQ